MRVRLIRNATLSVELAGRRLLVDPMLDPAGARPPVENTLPERRNPLVIAVHLEASNHCLVTRAQLRAATRGARVAVPDDGEVVAVGSGA